MMQEEPVDTSLNLDDKLVKAAQEATGETDERTAVETVLRGALVPEQPVKSMFNLIGRVNIRDDYDYKAMRAGDAVPD